MRTQAEFMRGLAAIGLACRPEFKVDRFVLEVYDQHLAPYGWDRVCDALMRIMGTREVSDPFPSVNCIKRVMGVAIELRPERVSEDQADRAEAVDMSQKIIEAMVKHGWCNPKAAEIHLGEFGWHIVRILGGWRMVSDELEMCSSVETYRAQIRDIIQAQLVKRRLGHIQLPGLPAGTIAGVLPEAARQAIALVSAAGIDVAAPARKGEPVKIVNPDGRAALGANLRRFKESLADAKKTD